ncbi:hypothetical protein T552_03088 [Pneumocystis carinii B80]|uniref:Rhodanese domain-containing protein n=1 Tax=Pneumocystis carinii (strain B80) TaxID=1408658 RepID=A0A0W4ZCQ3_PNEC8|nr:hypothetical protein T552_03088 [Pneumocystis carinii B80]KTW26196.1 hypothetical protein T552_03088 [Pneumocystis carinii B80]
MKDILYIEPQELSLKLKNTGNKGKDLVIVDVRDEDFIGGHIKGALHIPSHELSSCILNLIEETKDAKEVIFYCAYSQQRGPAGARLFLMEQQKIRNIKSIQEEEIFPKVYVLRGGFVEWQKKYGNDEKLTDKYNKKLWGDN